jgi:hypothetical protein
MVDQRFVPAASSGAPGVAELDEERAAVRVRANRSSPRRVSVYPTHITDSGFSSQAKSICANRFSAWLPTAELLARPGRVLVEVGPGHSR